MFVAIAVLLAACSPDNPWEDTGRDSMETPDDDLGDKPSDEGGDNSSAGELKTPYFEYPETLKPSDDYV